MWNRVWAVFPGEMRKPAFKSSSGKEGEVKGDENVDDQEGKKGGIEDIEGEIRLYSERVLPGTAARGVGRTGTARGLPGDQLVDVMGREGGRSVKKEAPE